MLLLPRWRYCRKRIDCRRVPRRISLSRWQREWEIWCCVFRPRDRWSISTEGLSGHDIYGTKLGTAARVISLVGALSGSHLLAAGILSPLVSRMAKIRNAIREGYQYEEGVAAVGKAERILNKLGSSARRLTEEEAGALHKAYKRAPRVIEETLEKAPANLGKYSKLVDESAEIVITKPFGRPAVQEMSREALDVRQTIKEGRRTVYRIGRYGETKTTPARVGFNDSPTERSTRKPAYHEGLQ